jgi:hypothetical protein
MDGKWSLYFSARQTGRGKLRHELSGYRKPEAKMGGEKDDQNVFLDPAQCSWSLS